MEAGLEVHEMLEDPASANASPKSENGNQREHAVYVQLEVQLERV